MYNWNYITVGLKQSYLKIKAVEGSFKMLSQLTHDTSEGSIKRYLYGGDS